MSTKKPNRRTKYLGNGARQSFYADAHLLSYVKSEAERKKRSTSTELVDLLEQGIACRDGQPALAALIIARSQIKG